MDFDTVLLDNLTGQWNPPKIKASLVENYLANRIGNSFNSSIDTWLTNHPLIAWLANHPLVTLLTSLIVIILTVRLILTIYLAIANLIDQMWLAILRSPWRLLQFIFGWKPKSIAPIENTTVTNYQVTDNSVQLQEIMTRLDQIQQQQQEIIQDLALLKQQPLTIDLQKPKLIDTQH